MISTNFINECKNDAYQNRLGKITIDGLENPITNSDILQSIEIDSGCYVDGNIIGSACCKCLKANFLEDIGTLYDKKIYAQIGVKYDDLNDEYINMGKYTIERPNNEITANMSQITAYDDLYTNLDNKYVCGIDYSKGNIKLRDLYSDVCNQLGLVPVTLNILNWNIPISNNPFTNNETNRTVLQTVAKISCSFIDIDNDNNKIDLCWLNNSDEPNYTFYKSDYVSVDGGKIEYGPINCLIIKNGVVDDENVTIKDNDSIALYGEHSITISDDYILYNADLRQLAIKTIWNRVKGMKYVDCKLTTYYGKPFLKLGDKIRIYTSETEYFDTYILKHNFTYDGAFTSVIESPALTEQEIKTKQDMTLGQALRNTQIIVDKQNQKISSVVEDVDEQNSKIANIEQMVGSIESLVSGEYGMTKTVNGFNQLYIEDALKYYPLELKIKGYSNLGNLLYPGTFYPGANIVPLKYNESSLTSLTLCIDKQPRNNPTSDKKEYLINIEEPLRSLNSIKDELNIFINDDGEFKANITRYLDYDGSQIIKLDNPIVEEIEVPPIELFEDSNYVYIKELSDYEMYVKYLIYSEINKNFATKIELKTSIKQTEDSINLEVSKKTNKDEIISTINMSAETTKIATPKLDIDGIAEFTNAKLAESGSTVINGSNIKTGTIDASQVTVNNLNASNIKAGSIDASNINITNLNASNIKTGSLSADRISGGTLQGAKVIANDGSIGGWTINSSGLTNGKVFLHSDGSSTIYTVADLIIMRGHILGLNGFKLTSDAIIKHYDLNGDGKVDSQDYVLLQKLIGITM